MEFYNETGLYLVELGPHQFCFYIHVQCWSVIELIRQRQNPKINILKLHLNCSQNAKTYVYKTPVLNLSSADASLWTPVKLCSTRTRLRWLGHHKVCGAWQAHDLCCNREHMGGIHCWSFITVWWKTTQFPHLTTQQGHRHWEAQWMKGIQSITASLEHMLCWNTHCCS